MCVVSLLFVIRKRIEEPKKRIYARIDRFRDTFMCFKNETRSLYGVIVSNLYSVLMMSVSSRSRT